MLKRTLQKWQKKPWFLVIVIFLLLASQYLTPLAQEWLDSNPSTDSANNRPLTRDIAKLQEAYRHQQSKVWVSDIAFKVVKLLPDDRQGSAHQRFLVSHPQFTKSLLISHNIDLAPYIPLHTGAQITVAGRYEWNEKGGVIHWTHRDPRGQRAGGWIEFDGQRYH